MSCLFVEDGACLMDNECASIELACRVDIQVFPVLWVEFRFPQFYPAFIVLDTGLARITLQKFLGRTYPYAPSEFHPIIPVWPELKQLAQFVNRLFSDHLLTTTIGA